MDVERKQVERKGPGRRYPFQWRAYVSLLLLLAGVLLAVSGVVLYVAPSGRIAKTVEWRMLGFDKGQWEALHTVFGFVFLYFSYLHVRYNWRSILSYLRRKSGRLARLRKELALAGLTVTLLAVGSAYDLPPVKQIMGFGESFNDFWEFWGEDRGYYVVGEEEAHPEESAAEGDASAQSEAGGQTKTSSRGYGRLSVADLAESEGVAAETALERLAEYGVKAEPDDNMLTLSGRTGYTPGELAAIIRGEDPDSYGE